MSDISSLQAELARQESINRELRSELYELESGVAGANNELTNFQNNAIQTLSNSNQRIERSHENVVRAYEIQGEIDKLYVRFKNMELANKKIRECNNKVYYDFNNYTMVRKIVQGMMDNLNVNMVSDEKIYQMVEKKHLVTPDYWLTSVLISVMAWKNDDKALADRATAKALELDKKNSAIFYMLFNLRMHRDEAALKWFLEYQHCDLKGSDERTFLLLFSMLSKTMHDEVTEKIKLEILEFINKVIAMNARKEGFSEQEMLDRIERYLRNMAEADDSEFNMLKRCLGDYADLSNILSLAKNQAHILQFVLNVANVSEEERNTYLSDFIDEEIAKPNSAEESVYDEIEYNELVISCGGDMEKTERTYQELVEKRRKDLNLIQEMIYWIYDHGADKDVNGQVRKNMFTLLINLQKKAEDQYTEHYRRRVKNIHPITLGDYKTEADFSNRTSEEQKIAVYYEEQRDAQLAALGNKMVIVGAIIAVLGVAGVFFLSPATLVLTAAGILMAVFTVISNKRHRKQILSTCELNINSKKQLLGQVLAEFDSWKNAFAEADSYYDRVTHALNEF